MKTVLGLTVLLFCISVPAQPVPGHSTREPGRPVPGGDYVVVERGANHRVWARTTVSSNAVGRVLIQTNSYIELASGLCYADNRHGSPVWADSKAEFEPVPGGAVARQGQHKLFIRNELTSERGVTELELPDGTRLVGGIRGLSYFDPTSGTNILMAEIKPSQGEIAGPSTVVFPDALDTVRATVRYTYSLNGMEQDLIIESQLPDPREWGLNPASCIVQVLSTFHSPPEPGKTARAMRLNSGAQVDDEDLLFGGYTVGRGRAFSLHPSGSEPDVPVFKRWVDWNGHKVMVEQAEFLDLHSRLQSLPKAEGAYRECLTNRVHRLASVQEALPLIGKNSKSSSKPMLLSQNSLPKAGVLWDYAITMPATATNYTFKSDCTYYISGNVSLIGTNIWEGGSVLKYATGASITVSWSSLTPKVEFRTSPRRPVFFTAKDDPTVGETISGAGGLWGYYAENALELPGGTYPSIQYARFAYSKCALNLGGACTTVSDCQFIDCREGGAHAAVPAIFRNVLFANVETNLTIDGSVGVTIENCTSSRSACLVAGPTSQNGANLAATNCVFSQVTNLYAGLVTMSGSHNGFYNTTTFGSSTFSSSVYPFQTVIGGAYYLTDDSACGFRNVGTTNISATTLTNLANKTTYPPILFTGGFVSADATLYPQAQRDTDTPDLGWHYDPMDYLFTFTIITNATWVVQPGTVIGTYGSYGLTISYSTTFDCQGTPTRPNAVTRYNLIQENSGTNYANSDARCILGDWRGGSGGHLPAATFRFTDWSSPAADGYLFMTYTHFGTNVFRDCQFHGGKVFAGIAECYFTNCLFERVNLGITDTGSVISPVVQSCLHYGGVLCLDRCEDAGTWIFRDNLFDGVSITQYYSAVDHGYNGYTPGTTRLTNSSNSDVVASLTYQSGPLGNYYQPTNSAFLDAGSVTNAALLGFYHYTTLTNQVKEATNRLDIGYHYVAVDTSGKPIDTDGDGIPDYFEDRDGDGIADASETDWQVSENGTTSAPGLKVYTPLK